MKTTVAVFFGGRSVEHEISVISASQAMHAMNRDKYNVIPVYITKQGRWVTGDALFDVKNYRDMKALVEKCEEVYMRPEFGDFNLYRAKTKLFGGHNVYAAIDVVDFRNYNYGLDQLIAANDYDQILVLYSYASFTTDPYLYRAGVAG